MRLPLCLLVPARHARHGAALSWGGGPSRQSGDMTSTGTPKAAAIRTIGLTKRYGGRTAVDDLSFSVVAGRVTGFLGPDGAGKSTTMRLELGLERPDAGTATVFGRPYAELEAPLRRVGAMLETRSFHPGRSGRKHLQPGATFGQLAVGVLGVLLMASEHATGMAQRRSNGAIAEELTVSERAVEKHVARIFTKLSLPVSATDHRRVLAVFRYLGA